MSAKLCVTVDRLISKLPACELVVCTARENNRVKIVTRACIVLSLNRITSDYCYFCSPGYLYTRQPFLQPFGDFETADRDSACMELDAGKIKI